MKLALKPKKKKQIKTIKIIIRLTAILIVKRIASIRNITIKVRIDQGLNLLYSEQIIACQKEWTI